MNMTLPRSGAKCAPDLLGLGVLALAGLATVAIADAKIAQSQATLLEERAEAYQRGESRKREAEAALDELAASIAARLRSVASSAPQ